MLSFEFKSALQALKDQAAVASAQFLNQDRTLSLGELADAHHRMSMHAREVSIIVKLLLKSGDADLTVQTLTEQRLAVELVALKSVFSSKPDWTAKQ